MSGHFNLNFFHGVPPIDAWLALLDAHNIVRRLPENELDEVKRIMNGGDNERYNVTIRWHESHHAGCPFLCGTAPQIAQSDAESDATMSAKVPPETPASDPASSSASACA